MLADELTNYRVRSVTRALDVLIELARNDGPMQLVPLARRLDLHPTTTLRMLASLRARGMVRLRQHTLYDLGPMTLELGKSFVRRIAISSSAQALVEDLANRINETASMGTLDDGKVLYVAIAHGQPEVGIESSPFAHHPVHCTALGKALLADLPWSEVEKILALHPPKPLTPNTLTDSSRLRTELGKIRAQGHAVDNEERLTGITCVAAPIRHRADTVAAISVSAPAFRVDREWVATLAKTVKETAVRISAHLGSTPAPFAGSAAEGSP